MEAMMGRPEEARRTSGKELSRCGRWRVRRRTIAEGVEGGVKIVWGFVGGNWAAAWSIELDLMVLFAHVVFLYGIFEKADLAYHWQIFIGGGEEMWTPSCGESVVDKSAGVLQACANGSVSAVCKSVSLGGKWDRLS